MNINKNEIMKTAASQLRKLSAKVKEQEEEIEKESFVRNFLYKIADNFSGEELLDKYAEYMKKDLEELKIMDKALEFSKTGELNLGTLSTQTADNGSMDPLTAMLIEEQ